MDEVSNEEKHTVLCICSESPASIIYTIVVLKVPPELGQSFDMSKRGNVLGKV